jgi:hypothetical protein
MNAELIYVGIDVSKANLDLCVSSSGKAQTFSNDRTGQDRTRCLSFCVIRLWAWWYWRLRICMCCGTANARSARGRYQPSSGA